MAVPLCSFGINTPFQLPNASSALPLDGDLDLGAVSSECVNAGFVSLKLLLGLVLLEIELVDALIDKANTMGGEPGCEHIARAALDRGIRFQRLKFVAINH